MFHNNSDSYKQAAERYLRDIEGNFLFDAAHGIYKPKAYYEKQKRSRIKKVWKNFRKYWAMVFINAVTLIAVLRYADYARKQWVEMKRAADATECAAKAAGQSAVEAKNANDFSRDALVRVQRAFIVINPNNMLSQISIDMGEEKMHLFLLMENSGTTPTRHLSAHMNHYIGTPPLPTNFAYPDADEISGADDAVPVIGPKNSFPLEATILREKYEVFKRHQAHLYLYGWVEYNDIFADTPRHLTRFCYEVHPIDRARLASGQEGSAVQLTPHGTFFNCYDEDCRPRKNGH